jgi:hypothetical protein
VKALNGSVLAIVPFNWRLPTIRCGHKYPVPFASRDNGIRVHAKSMTRDCAVSSTQKKPPQRTGAASLAFGWQPIAYAADATLPRRCGWRYRRPTVKESREMFTIVRRLSSASFVDFGQFTARTHKCAGEAVPNRNSPPAILLRESYRESGKVRKRILCNLSDWPVAQIEGLRGVLRGGIVIPASVMPSPGPPTDLRTPSADHPDGR